jgi:hypothetical protein
LKKKLVAGAESLKQLRGVSSGLVDRSVPL